MAGVAPLYANSYPWPTGQDDYWKADGFVALKVSAEAAYAGFTSFGIYDPSNASGTRVELFRGSAWESAGAESTVQIYTVGNSLLGIEAGDVFVNDVKVAHYASSPTTSGNIGFYLDSGKYRRGGLFYSDASLNEVDANGTHVDHMITEGLSDGSFLLQWEDVKWGGDWDYNDLVVKITPLPEEQQGSDIRVPDVGGTLALLGGALLGLTWIRRWRA